MKKKWQIYEVEQEKTNKISMQYHINKLLASILVNRNIEEDKIEAFLNPTRKSFHDPF